jgi:hypothetical protein
MTGLGAAVEKFQAEKRLPASGAAADERDPPLRQTAVQDFIQALDLRGYFANSDRIFHVGFSGGGSIRSVHENTLGFSSQQGAVSHSNSQEPIATVHPLRHIVFNAPRPL